jgi:sugar lactone lactonase YvrE
MLKPGTRQRPLAALADAGLVRAFAGALAALCVCAYGSEARAQQQRIQTIAGAGGAENSGDAGRALELNINQPFGLALGPNESLVVTEVGHHRLRRLDLKTGKLQTIAGTGKKGYSGDGGPAAEAAMNEPYEVRFDRDGNLYVVEMQNHLVRRIDAATSKITTIAGSGTAGFGGDGGPATKAQLRQPHSIALSPDAATSSGYLYIADIGNHRIRRVALKTGVIETIAGNGKAELPRAGGVAAGNAVAGPRALFTTGDTLWVALREGHSVWKIDLTKGTWAHVGGTGKRGYGGDGGPGTDATFDGPKGIALGKDGSVYVVDTENQAIRRIDAKLQTISTIAGAGPAARGFAGDGDDATKAKLDRPHGIIVDSAGSVYIADTNNHRVRVISALGERGALAP